LAPHFFVSTIHQVLGPSPCILEFALRNDLFKGGPEPLEKEIHEILGSKRHDRFSNHFSELVQKTCQVPAWAW